MFLYSKVTFFTAIDLQVIENLTDNYLTKIKIRLNMVIETDDNWRVVRKLLS